MNPKKNTPSSFRKNFPFPFRKIFNSPGYLLIILQFLFLQTCSSSYVEVIQKIETSFYEGNYETAIPEIRNLVLDGEEKDKLLYLMEAGVILHSKGDYEASNKAFLQADGLAETINVSISRSAKSFLLSDNESDFTGENFERVMIKLYIALNYLALGETDSAKRYFQKLDYDLKEMKLMEASYKQNLLARYLDAITSESLGRFNDARVQYKNLLEFDNSKQIILSDRYVLAFKEGDSKDMGKFQDGKNSILSFGQNLGSEEINDNLGELIVVNEAGKTAIKESRGKLIDDPAFMMPLRVSIEASLRTYSSQGLTVSGVIAMLGVAENPIPVYKARDLEATKEALLLVNGKQIGRLKKFTDYSDTAMANYNDNYNSIVTKNVASIATKIVVAAVASYAAGQAVKSRNDNNELLGTAVSFISGLASGYAIAKSLKPDLRCWRTMPSNFQSRRVFLKPGEYEITLKNGQRSYTKKVKVEKSKPSFLLFRTL